MATAFTAEEVRSLVRRFDATCVQHFQGATSLCVSRTHYEITPDHLLLRLMDDAAGDVTRILDAYKVDRAAIRRALQRILEDLPAGHRGKPTLSTTLVGIFQSAAVLADELGFDQIRTGLLLLAYVLNPGCTRVGELTPELDRIDANQLRDHFSEIVLGSTETPGGMETLAGPRPGEGGALEQFTVDLTAKARAGEIDPVFSRDREIRQMIDIFARRRKNNPILVGEPGTGKTAIVEGLALRIVEGDVPPVLQGVKLLAMDIGLLQAGASVKGEFENRVKNVIKEIKASPTPIITFIDEVHQLIGAGGTAGSSDASTLLKPALARGELRTCAATTWAEYKKYFEKDAALERRFQLVRCEEPAAADAVVMLRGLKHHYEKHHQVVILDDAITAAVSLSQRYVSGRFLPDKAVDLLDTSAARVAVSLGTRPGALDDLDRGLTNLDTAIAALERDRAGGIGIDEERLAEMQSSRTTLLQERDGLEQKWKTEIDSVRHIQDLRSQLKADGESDIRRQIDQALTALRAAQGEKPLVHPHVDSTVVAAVVSDWTGIPAGNMVKDEVAAILAIEDRLRERVVGQDHALRTVAEKLRTSRAGLSNPVQPMGVFLCVGPSGVGKTELALSVADLLFGGDQLLTSINMSEFMEKHTVSQLKGSPPGYVGYGEGGVLTEAARQHPYSVILLDEVEKAHPDVMNLFYQVFDKGVLADGEGRVVSFKNTVIFLTSNLGTDVIQSMCESGEAIDTSDLKEAVYPQLREHFKPALVARMIVIPFLTLGSEILQQIARMKLQKVADRLKSAHRVRFAAEDSVFAKIAEQCHQVDLGARQIDHLLDRVVLPELSRRLLEEMTKDTVPTAVTMGAGEEGMFTYAFSST
jgi:type VI secretion system protein VasG